MAATGAASPCRRINRLARSIPEQTETWVTLRTGHMGRPYRGLPDLAYPFQDRHPRLSLRTHLHAQEEDQHLNRALQPIDNLFGPRLSPMSLGTIRCPCLRAGHRQIWSGRWDLNPRPSRWQRDALPLSYTRIRKAAATRRRRARFMRQSGRDCKPERTAG